MADGAVTIRVLRPLASVVEIETLAGTFAATHEHHGVWVAEIPGADAPDYRVHVTYDADPVITDDPYRFLPTLGELDLHLIREGRHERLWDVLGANVKRYPSVLGDVTGTAFAVWAPNARAVRIVGDFNMWQGATHAMRSLGVSGVWELFIPGIGNGTAYKYEILGKDGRWRQKADPMAKYAELPPQTASVVTESVVRVERRGVDGRPTAPPAAPVAHEHLRGPPWLVAPGPQLPGSRERARGIRQGPWLHARGVHARHGAPVRRFVGLPGLVVLRADVALRLSRRLPFPR